MKVGEASKIMLIPPRNLFSLPSSELAFKNNTGDVGEVSCFPGKLQDLKFGVNSGR
jgi:hypothetical protein